MITFLEVIDELEKRNVGEPKVYFPANLMVARQNLNTYQIIC
jgi:hypothetical protein